MSFRKNLHRTTITMMRFAVAATLAVTLAGCGSAAGSLAPGALGVSARDAYVEARSVAEVWASDARLRWVEGTDLAPSGIALVEEGAWHFHYTSRSSTRELVVTVQPLATDSEERPVTSPPGIVIGDNALGTAWVDSRIVMDEIAARTDGVEGPVSMLLVPTRPEQWIVRTGEERWRLDAETAEVVSP